MTATIREDQLDAAAISAAARAKKNDRVAQIVATLEASILDGLKKAEVSHDEFRGAIKFFAEAQAAKEMPLLLMAFLEGKMLHQIEATEAEASRGTILGPYFLEDHPRLEAPFKLPMREDEPGTPLEVDLTVLDISGAPLPRARVDIWQADNFGEYSGFSSAPRGNLRGWAETDAEGRLRFSTIKPAPYPIPDAGPTGRLLNALGRHSWRPSHVHILVSAEGYRQHVTQLYFEGGEFVDSDSCHGVLDTLLLKPEKNAEGGLRAAHTLRLSKR